MSVGYIFVHLHDAGCIIGFMEKKNPPLFSETQVHRSEMMSDCAAAAVDMTGGAAIICVY